MVQFIAFQMTGIQEIIGHVAIFHQQDGRLWMGGTNCLHSIFSTFVDVFWRHVGQAVQYEHGGVQLDDKLDHFGFHSAVAGKAQVDYFSIEHAS